MTMVIWLWHTVHYYSETTAFDYVYQPPMTSIEFWGKQCGPQSL